MVDPFDQTVSARTATLGPATREAFREVTAGLEANQMIVVHASRPLQQGMRVRYQKTLSPSTTGDR